MSPPRLSEASLHALRADVATPRYDRNAMRVGIVHFGPGAFHRAHQAHYVDALLHTDLRWGISAISLKSSGVRDALMPQDGLYTLTELSDRRRVRVIGAIREVLVAAQQREQAFARLIAPETAIVTLTVTEKGYCLDARNELDTMHPDIQHDWNNPSAPRSVLGWLSEALRRRRAQHAAPFAIVCCDNLANNGQVLRSALIAFADRIDPDLARWIEAQASCPRTMVDSITPATDDSLREQVAQAAGVVDAWPVQREAFTQWVIEDVPAIKVADWRCVGVTLATDVGVYDRAKLRLLNGAHSTLAYVGLLRGHETVRDAMSDAPLASFVERLMREDIAANLGPTAQLDVPSYIDAVLERFRNPGVRHLLSQIAWDGSKKLPVRIMGTLQDALRSGRPIDRLTVPIAAWMRFIQRQAKAGAEITDPDAQRLASAGRACTGEAEHDVELFASLDTVVSPALLANATFRSTLTGTYAALASPNALPDEM